ncbi:hypothetical protein N7495_009142 [Penicillium taxi]|uniref:uncharacterized protein n=1 Tax=Penicillium taxi TaxID=168475 RepID=UPI002545AB3C|nr:uncharacterized protein N7495_009142 [Penicillium taxi]KAJ5884632.1 hypothetical protein N7495_009142 [Penicillium taxi]
MPLPDKNKDSFVSPYLSNTEKDHKLDTPILIVDIECPLPVVEYLDYFPLTINVTYYQRHPGESRPIVFHINSFQTIWLYIQRGDSWEAAEEPTPGFALFDNPDIQVAVGRSDEFASLCPGETWSWTYTEEVPDNAEVGDTLRSQFEETQLDWWDWGSKEDHTSTMVTLPFVQGHDVLEPKDNDGRPRIVIPASDPIDRKVVPRDLSKVTFETTCT